MVQIVNKKAKFEYNILKEYSAGICLIGEEVKSIKNSRVSMNDSFCFFSNHELWIKNLRVDCVTESDAQRDKKILLKKTELRKLETSLEKGLTIIPTKIFTNQRGKIKLEVALCRGKKMYDKRESIRIRDIERDIKRLKW